MRPNVEFAEVARYSFSASEYTSWRALPVEDQREAFFQCWARKEAYIKARGMGLSLDLSLFDVAFIQGEPPRLLASREDEREVERWQFYRLDPDPQYASALVVEGDACQLRCLSWDSQACLAALDSSRL
jgi:4'-phosphopantetheinyl transferase